MPAVRSGRWVPERVRSAPLSVEAFLADIALRKSGSSSSRVLVTEDDVRNVFALQPTALDLRDIVFANPGVFADFCSELSRSIILVSVSFTNVCVPDAGGSPRWLPLWNALVENVAVESMRLHDLPELGVDDARCIAESVLPWNRTVVEWSFSGCTRMGDAGAAAVAGALAQTASSVQRLSFRNCGLSHSLPEILASLRLLSSLTQLDVGANPAALRELQSLELLREMDELLHRNTKLLHPAEVVEHTAVFDASDAVAPTSAVSPLMPTEIARASDEHSKDEAEAFQGSSAAAGSPLRRRGSQVQARVVAADPATSAASPLSRRRSSFVKPTSAPSDARRAGAPVTPTAKEGTSASGSPAVERRSSIRHAPPSAATTSAPHTPPLASAAATPAPATTADHGQSLNWGDHSSDSLVHVSALTAEEAMSGTPGAASPAIPAPDISPVLRRQSNAEKSLVVTPSRSQTANHTVTSKPLVADVTAGAEAWQRIKEQYNSYIRAGSPSATRHSRDGSHRSPSLREVALQSPRFVLGKMISKDKGRPSSSFAPSTVNAMYVRDAMPSERRKFAPWLEGSRTPDMQASSSVTGDPHMAPQISGRSRSGSPSLSRTFVGKRVLRVAEHSDPKHPVVIRIVDGGDVTMIENDPREIGYSSRLAETGRVSLRKSAAFASNTVRDARWGVDPRTQVARVSQAPPPGSYDVPSSFEASVAKTPKRSVTATGKPMFGVSGSERLLMSKPQTSDVPGPGFYEIP